MIYLAYQLLPRLKYLALCGVDAEGELEWVGTKEEWQRAELEETKHENDYR